jgi:DNA-binding NarL/FixJ family response regulator
MCGYNNKIADRLRDPVAIAKLHLQHLYEKLHVHLRTEVALKFKQE